MDIARRYRELVTGGLANPSEILVLASSNRTLDSLRDALSPESTECAQLYTMHGFCSRLLRENAFEAGLDPRFSILPDARRRVILARLADEVIESRRDELDRIGLLANAGHDAVREAIITVHEALRANPREESAPPACDPRPFREAFERCCREIISPSEEWPASDVLVRIKAEMAGALNAVEQLTSSLAGDPDWRSFRKLRVYRGRFHRPLGFEPLDHLLRATRDALDSFMAACLEAQSERGANLIRGAASDLADRYSAEKERLGSLDLDDFAPRAMDLLRRCPEVADRYRNEFKLVIQADAGDLTPAHREIVSAISRSDGLICESATGPGGFVQGFFKEVWSEDRVECPSFDPDAREPPVEIILLPADFRGPRAGGRMIRTEARMIAQRILEMIGRLGDDPPLLIGDEPVRFRDIMILARSGSSARVYERVLEDHGIPVCAVGGRGFYDAREIRDILAILVTLDDPRDDALAEIVESALERSRFDLRVLAMKGGRRRYANVRKLLDIAREAESDGAGLSEFIAQTEYLREIGVRESEAATQSEDGDSVRIMTVYAASASGGRAPIVFIADMSWPLGTQVGLVARAPDRGLSALVANPHAKRLETPLGYREAAEVIQDARITEEKKLLCEAMTRAEERLILVGSSTLAGQPESTYRETKSWTGWLEKALDLGPGTPEGDVSFDGARVRFRFRPPSPVKASDLAPATTATRFARKLREGLPIPGIEPDSEAGRIARDAFDRCFAERPATPVRVGRLSVSRALDYLQCPARYRLLHVRGMPEEAGDPREDADEIEFSAADLGHAVHDILARLDFSADLGHQLASFLPEIAGERLRGEAGPLIERFAQSPWAGELRRAERILKEVPFEIAVEGRIIPGRIDLAYRDAGGWTVLDYKTGRAEDRERYELQVGIYAHAISRLLGEMPARVGLIYLSIGEEWVQSTSDGEASSCAADTFIRVIAGIESGRFDPIPGAHCDWCAGSPACGKELYSI